MSSATNVRTGRPRIFGPGEVAVDARDGLGLPAADVPGGRDRRRGLLGRRLSPATPRSIRWSGTRRRADILVVQINPIVRHDLPKSARDIINRVNEISFNSSLIKELRSITLMQRVAARRGSTSATPATPTCT